MGVIAIEDWQRKGWRALCGPSPHVLLYGGARSGKTQLIVLWLVLRALAAPKATHAVFRHHFNALKSSIIYDTLPDVCERYWPSQRIYTLNKSDWYADFAGGGRVYFGGLDDKERTEKILGQGHSTIYLNEASQISYGARTKAVTRLSQRRGLSLKAVCDENPPMQGHWTYQLYIKGIDPHDQTKVADASQYAHAQMNPVDNPYIPEATRRIYQQMPAAERQRFWDGEFGTGTAAPLWTLESLEQARLAPATPDAHPVALSRILIAVDPSGCRGPDDERSDEVGIVVVGLGTDDCVYVLEDASGRMGPSGMDGWAAKVASLFYKWRADRVIAETNFGGAMVVATIKTFDENIPCREVVASRGKVPRAEPVAQLFANRRAFLCGRFKKLEGQLVQFSTAGYEGEKSPDRADAMVWAIDALGVVTPTGYGVLRYTQQQAAKATQPPLAAPVATPAAGGLVLRAPAHIQGTYHAADGHAHVISDGLVLATAAQAPALQAAGFVPV